MCGISGSFDPFKPCGEGDMQEIALAMGNAIRHRGPDENGEWVDANSGILLAHRRLSIQDLSPAGRQPMISHSGRFVIVYNGEIYNGATLKADLQKTGSTFKGHSDTEILVEALATWGVEKTLPKLVGMFAFALWDREEQSLVLARDRMGIKPLYWGKQGKMLFFTSELKSLFAHPAFTPQVDRSALADLVTFNYVPGPQSIYQGIDHLEPGTYVHIDRGGNAKTNTYWNMVEIAARGETEPFVGTDAEAISQLNKLLEQSIKGRMVADVPLGAFLSGGIDSTLVSAVMQSISLKPIKTFTIGFGEGAFDEAPYARAIAKHLGTEHFEHQVTGQEALDVIPKLSQMFCEPFADSSQIPTHLVSVMARQHVTVALSGDGGDEGFAGYNRHLVGQEYWPKVSGVPIPLRSILAGGMKALSANTYDQLANLLPRSKRPSQLGNKMHKMAGLLESRDLDDFYAGVVRFWKDLNNLGLKGSNSWSQKMERVSIMSNPVSRMQIMDMITYLPGDILTKVDRASMAVGLEARVPLLDHRVIEFANQLPTHMKIRNGETKWLLRQALDQYVPRPLLERPKQGFAIPLGTWLRGPLRDWAEDLLSEKSLTNASLFNPIPVRQKWHQHLYGSHQHQDQLWSILMAQSWWREWGETYSF